MKRFIYLIIWLLLPTWALAQTNISDVEYWYDGDYGTAIQQTVTPGASVTYTDLLDLSSLEPGLHTVTVRFRDSRGIWGSVLTQFFTYYPGSDIGIHLLTDAEYWFDGDYVTLVETPLTPGASVDLNTLLDVSSLIDGLHTVTLRFKDDRGTWSSLLVRFFKKEGTGGLKQLVAAEYWFNDDYANKHDSSFAATSSLDLTGMLDISTLHDGFNFVSIRVQDESGKWGPVPSWFFTKEDQESLPQLHQITALEYWYDGDYSTVQNDPVSATSLLALDTNLDVSALDDGLHTVSTRYRDEAGNWSPVFSSFFTKYPAEAAADMHEISELEYWFDGDYSTIQNDPVASTTQLDLNTLLDVSALNDGLHVASIRFKDETGNWSPAFSHLFSKYPEEASAELHQLVSVEYWIDGGATNAVKSTISPGSDYMLDTQLDVSALSDGLHFISYRFQDEAGVWSSAFSHLFSKYEDEVLPANNKIVSYRYWANDQIGSATEITLHTPVQVLDLDDLIDVSALPGGTNDISFQFVDSLGNWSSALTKSYTQDYNPRGTITAQTNPACTNSTATFTAATTDVDSIYWDFGDSTAIVGRLANEDAYHIYQNAGDYTVTATLLNVDSASTDTTTTNITVNQSYGIAVVAPQNLIAYYPFDGDASDASGSGHDGTVSGAILTEDRSGNTNSAYLFDGNDGILIPHSDELNMSGPLSFSCWIKPAVLQNAMIFGKSNYSTATNYLLRIQSDGNIQWEYDGYLNTTTNPVEANKWYHIVVTANNPGEYRQVFVNGTLVAETNSSSGPFGNVTNPFTIGYASRGAEYFRGAIDDVRIFDTALSAEEVYLLYQGTEGTDLPPIEVEICDNETPYVFGSQTIAESGTYYESYHTVLGCDSIVQLNLTIHPTYNDTIGEPLNFQINDDFEADALGTLPDGWVIRYDGTGASNQIVVNNPVKNGTQSFQVSGSGWAANLSKAVASFPEKVTLEAWVRIENVLTGGACGLSLGNPSIAEWGSFLGRVETESGNFITYNHSGSATTKYILQPAVAGTWTHIRIEYDYSSFKYKVFINGGQASGTNGSETLTEFPLLETVLPTSVELYSNSMVYFDDVKMYESGETALLICASETPYTFGSQQLTTSGFYTETFKSEFGCDSIVTINLIVNPSYEIDLVDTICENDLPYLLGDSTFYAPGSYSKVFTTTDGCDSIRNYTLIVNDTTLVQAEMTVCETDLPLIIGTDTFNTEGIYTNVFNNTGDCDSTVILTLNVLDTSLVNEEIEICESLLPFTFGTQILSASGVYTEAFSRAKGCDSTVVLTLTVKDTFVVADTLVVCETELPVEFGGTSLTTSGTYTEVLTAANGCDSTVTLLFTVNDTSLMEKEVTVCENDLPYTLGTQSLTSGGIYTEVFAGANGCDSTVVLTLNVLDTALVIEELVLCETDLPYTFGTQSLTSGGTFTEVLTGNNGCDSTVILALTVKDTFVVADTMTVCETDLPVQFGGTSLSTSGTYTEVFSAANGCDSTVTLLFTVNDTSVMEQEATVCESDLPYIAGTDTLTASGIYSKVFMGSNGCDSTVVLTLNILDTSLTNEEVTICESDLPYILGTQTLTSSGTFTEVLSGSNGCDSTVVLTLVVNDTFNFADTLTVCEKNLPFEFGTQLLTGDGTFTEVFTSSAGCDSTVVLVFSVSDTSSSAFADTVCEKELPYILGNQSIYVSGTYTETFAAQNGCDSVVTLSLIVYPGYKTNLAVTVEKSELPYIFGSLTLTKTGTYRTTMSTVFGCDSVLILDLKVEDNIAPTVQCNSIKVALSANGSYTLSAADLASIAQGSSDDITAFENLVIEATPSVFTCEHVGETSVTVQVSDAVGNEATCQATIRVFDELADPAIDKISDQTMEEDSTLQVLLTGISGGSQCDPWEVSVTANQNNIDLIDALNIEYLEYDSTAVLEIVPVANQYGTDSITVTVQDSLGNSASISFLLTVNEVNDLPVILEIIEDQSMTAEDTTTVFISKLPGVFFEDFDDSTLVFNFNLGDAGLPDWVNIEEQDEQFVLSFTPTAADTGCFDVVVSLQDLTGALVSDTFRVCIDPLEVGIFDMNENNFGLNLYPNPTQGNVRIDLDSPPYGKIELMVTNIAGSQVLRETYQSGEHIVFDLSNHISGTYLVIIQINEQRIVRKLILDKK